MGQFQLTQQTSDTFDKSGSNRSSFYKSKRFKQNVPLLIMFIPVLLFYGIFKYLPMAGLIIAFKDYNFLDGVFGSPWVGLKNFELLFQATNTVNVIRNTFVLSLLRIIVGFPAPIILAILLNEVRKAWFKSSVQTIIYIPHFFSWVIVGGIVLSIFSQETGIVNQFVKMVSGENYPFLYKPVSWIAIFIGSGIWKEAGFRTIIYLAALTGLDQSLYEAAVIDGANKWKQIWHITLPGIRPTIITLFILATGQIMEVGFDQVYVLQNSAVNHVADVISTYIYRVGLQGAQFSMTTVLGLFDSLIGLVFVLTSNWLMKKLFGEGLW
jgi:putative aldouronate transport system permease protein